MWKAENWLKGQTGERGGCLGCKPPRAVEDLTPLRTLVVSNFQVIMERVEHAGPFSVG